MDIRQTLGRNLARLRRERELSQEAFADLAELHRTYISGIERGIRNPTITIIEKLAVALNVEIAELVDQKDGRTTRT
jgi:transcriptional regulator with XRE-family HTH domain